MELSDLKVFKKFNFPRNGNNPSSPDSPTEKEPPKTVYRKIQRSHSAMNNYEQVRLIIRFEWKLEAFWGVFGCFRTAFEFFLTNY